MRITISSSDTAGEALSLPISREWSILLFCKSGLALGIEAFVEGLHPIRVRHWRTHLPGGKDFFIDSYSALG